MQTRLWKLLGECLRPLRGGPGSVGVSCCDVMLVMSDMSGFTAATAVGDSLEYKNEPEKERRCSL